MRCKHILYLASGSSRRFGANKLLANCGGKPLYLHGLEMLQALTQAREDCTLHVVSRYPEIRETARCLGIPGVDSPDSALGASYTIKAGLQTLGTIPEEDYLLFVVADQPRLGRASVERLLDLADGRTRTACLSNGATPGNPVLFSAGLIPELMALEGDQGGRTVARRHPCILVEADSRELWDIDYSEDLKQV